MVTVGPTGSEKGSTTTRDDTDDQPKQYNNYYYHASVTIALSYQVKKLVSVLSYSADIGHDLLP
jgi:hypothetical protein